ncbi:MAG: homocysteine S-methyltransferase family protein, partial [Clostridia bacterium]
IEQPEIVAEIHKAYVDAGSDVLYTNTFGANAYKLKGALQEVVSSAIKIARSAKPKYVALDIGPLGKIVGSNGISFDTAVLQFKKIVKAAADKTDFIVIETMTNLAELRAAIIATKECSKRPVIASMSFEKNNRTFFGVSVESFAVAMEALGVSAIGANCAQGPIEMYETAKALVNCTSLPVFIKPNAGMPTFKDGKTIYNISPDEFAAAMERISSLGISMLGGCCGTDPNYISKISSFKNSAPNRIIPQYKCRVSTSTTVLNFDDFKVIGERINPTGKKKLKCALIEQDYGQIVSIGLEQTREGADILDVNCGLSEIDETATMQKLVDELQTVVTCPLQIDSSNPKTLELALRHYNGRAIVNSVNGDEKSLNAILPVVHKYGACLIALTLDEKGIPKEPSNRLKIAKRIILAAEKCGIKREDIFFDALTLAEASERGNAVTTIKTVKMLSDLGLKTVLGVSNISFGMPNREDINAKFLEMAKVAGLTAAIINPKMLGFVGSDTARDFLEGASGSVEKYIAYATKIPEIKREATEKLTLKSAILYGQIDASTSIAREAVVSFARTNGENAV